MTDGFGLDPQPKEAEKETLDAGIKELAKDTDKPEDLENEIKTIEALKETTELTQNQIIKLDAITKSNELRLKMLEILNDRPESEVPMVDPYWAARDAFHMANHYLSKL